MSSGSKIDYMMAMARLKVKRIEVGNERSVIRDQVNSRFKISRKKQSRGYSESAFNHTRVAWDLNEHLYGTVKPELRAMNLLNGFMRGKKLEDVENTNREGNLLTDWCNHTVLKRLFANKKTFFPWVEDRDLLQWLTQDGRHNEALVEKFAGI